MIYFFKIYKILNITLYGEGVSPTPYYQDQTILKKKENIQKYEISYELLTVYQAGAIAFQTMLNIEAYKNTDISELSQILLQDAFHLSPVKFYQYDQSGGQVDKENFKKSYHKISHPKIGIEHDMLWQHILRKISHTPLASVWALFIPFLEKPFLKGLCPFSFYYHMTLSQNPNFVVQIAQRLLDAEQHFLTICHHH